MKKILSLIALIVIIIAGQYVQYPHDPINETKISTSNQDSAFNNQPSDLKQAFDKQQSDIQIQGSGIVIKVLKDDTQGSRHQRFILNVGNNQTLLIAHNIDLAPRIPQLKTGDRVDFYGEYEWNNKGGVLHWTHHDPGKRHIDGWLKHSGRTYQ